MSKWREHFKVHPAADVFPMMSDDALAMQGEDIKTNGLQLPIVLQGKWPKAGDDPAPKGAVLLAGRNRLEAMERAGLLEFDDEHLFASEQVDYYDGDPIAFVKSENLHRRHMLKSERVEAIVALAKMEANKPGHDGPVSEKGGRGKKSAVKQRAIEINAALPKENQVSERTIKRAIAKAEGRTPKPTAKPVEQAATVTVDPSGVEDATHVLANVLDTIKNSKAVAEAYRKIFKRSSFDREAKSQIQDEINLLIAKWRRVQSTLDSDEGSQWNKREAEEAWKPTKRQELFLHAAADLSIKDVRTLYAMNISCLSDEALLKEWGKFTALCREMRERLIRERSEVEVKQ